MPNKVVLLCDERDAEIAAALRAALSAQGHEASVVVCDAAAETLGAGPRDALARAAAAVVVLREGGRGNRLLRAVEDEAPASAQVLSLLADASPDAAVSARTAARIRTVRDAVGAALGGRRAPGRRWPLAAAALGAFAVLATALLLLVWPGRGGPSNKPLDDGPPVLLTGMLSNAGWMITFHLREEASLLEYKRPSDASFVPTGDMGPGFGPGMARPHAKPYVTLTDLHGKVPFLVRYQTLDGEQRGPYETVFDTQAEAITSVKRIFGDVPGWVSFRLFMDKKLCYFTFLLTYKYALSAVRYGIDRDTPDRKVRFVPGDRPGLHNDDELYIELPEDTSAVTVELVFLDGSTLGPKRFPFTY